MKYYFALIIFICSELSAQVIEPPQPSNLLTATVIATVTQDPNNQLYTYLYTVTNHSTSKQRLTSFTIDLSEDAQIVSVESPKGWDHGVTPDNALLMWDAVDIDPEDEPETWDGNLLPSSYDIKPGHSLSGFLVKTLILLCTIVSGIILFPDEKYLLEALRKNSFTILSSSE